MRTYHWMEIETVTYKCKPVGVGKAECHQNKTDMCRVHTQRGYEAHDELRSGTTLHPRRIGMRHCHWNEKKSGVKSWQKCSN